jgi:hypothetical protein
MEKKNVIGLIASLAVVLVITLLVRGSDDPTAATGILNVVLVVVAGTVFVIALVADPTPLRRVGRTRVLVVPAVMFAVVALLSLAQGLLPSAVTSAFVAALFAVIAVRSQQPADERG